jgi:hypothetical protein
MGLAAASHFIVNVAVTEAGPRLAITYGVPTMLISLTIQCLCKHQAELLLRIRGLLYLLPYSSMVLLSVSI